MKTHFFNVFCIQDRMCSSQNMMFCLLNRFGSLSIRQCYPTLSKVTIRDLSISRKPKYPKLADPSVHKIVYTFKYTQVCAGFLASKLYFPISSAVLGPCISYYLNSWELIGSVIISNVIHMTFVVVATKFLHNIVGAVFVNKEGEINEVIFSTIDKWGRRLDKKHNANDIVVLDSNVMLKSAGFFAVGIVNSDVRYKVNFNHANIYDSEACKYLFDDYAFVKSKKK